MSSEIWGQLVDRLLAGLAHDANGRATALRGIAILARTDEPAETWLELLDGEADRLERLALALSGLRTEGAEPLDAREAVRAAAPTLAAVHIELRTIESPADDDVSVILSRGALVRAVVALALQLSPSYTASVVEARVTRGDGEVVIELWRAGATSPEPPPLPLPEATCERTAEGYRLVVPAAT